MTGPRPWRGAGCARVWLVALMVGAAHPAFAAQSASKPVEDQATLQARAHFRQATRLYRQARYQEAVSEFQAAYRLKPHGVIHFNLAQCHERLGDIPAALNDYREYLREVPRAEDRETVLSAMSNLEARLGSMGVQQLIVLTEPGGAAVLVDGQLRGRTPLSATLALGTHSISVDLEHYETLHRQVELTPDRAIQLDFALAPLTLRPEDAPRPSPIPPPTPLAVNPATPAPVPLTGSLPAELAPAPSAAETPLVPREGEMARAQGRRRVYTWVAAGAAVVAAGAGLYYGIQAHNASNDLNSMTVPNGARAQDLANSASSRARTANILYGVAGAAAAAGVTLYFLEGRP